MLSNRLLEHPGFDSVVTQVVVKVVTKVGLVDRKERETDHYCSALYLIKLSDYRECWFSAFIYDENDNGLIDNLGRYMISIGSASTLGFILNDSSVNTVYLLCPCPLPLIYLISDIE